MVQQQFHREPGYISQNLLDKTRGLGGGGGGGADTRQSVTFMLNCSQGEEVVLSASGRNGGVTLMYSLFPCRMRAMV